MAYQVPNFPLTCRAHAWLPGPYPPGGPVAGSVDFLGQLRFLKTAAELGQSNALNFMLLLIAASTPLFGNTASQNGDFVEVPKGSGRWYQVMMVDAVAAGFSNEHQAAVIVQMTGIANLWPY